MKHNYSTKKYDKENMAKVFGRALPISTKFCIEICNFIREMGTSNAKKILQDVVDGKRAVPFKIFNDGLSHKRKIGPGRYPIKATTEIIGLIESAEANAQFKGLNTSDLCITHINAHLASRPWRYGRQRRRKAKRTHIEIIVEERKAKSEGKVKKESNADTVKKKEDIKKKTNVNKGEQKPKEVKEKPIENKATKEVKKE